MAKKNEPFMVFQTKEEYDRHVERMIAIGEDIGFRKGCIELLSRNYIALDYINDLFPDKIVLEAKARRRQLQIDCLNKELETYKKKLFEEKTNELEQ